MTTTSTTIQALAQEARRYFTPKTRPNGDIFQTRTDDCPQWVTDMTFAAHHDGQILPDDYRYQFIVEALDAIAEGYDDPETAIDELEPEHRTYQLLTWLRDSHDGPGYVDEYVTELGLLLLPGDMGGNAGLVPLVMGAYGIEQREVAYTVLEALTERMEELDAS